jgi:hypothetical protein
LLLNPPVSTFVARSTAVRWKGQQRITRSSALRRRATENGAVAAVEEGQRSTSPLPPLHPATTTRMWRSGTSSSDGRIMLSSPTGSSNRLCIVCRGAPEQARAAADGDSGPPVLSSGADLAALLQDCHLQQAQAHYRHRGYLTLHDEELPPANSDDHTQVGCQSTSPPMEPQVEPQDWV